MVSSSHTEKKICVNYHNSGGQEGGTSQILSDKCFCDNARIFTNLLANAVPYPHVPIFVLSKTSEIRLSAYECSWCLWLRILLLLNALLSRLLIWMQPLRSYLHTSCFGECAAQTFPFWYYMCLFFWKAFSPEVRIRQQFNSLKRHREKIDSTVIFRRKRPHLVFKGVVLFSSLGLLLLTADAKENCFSKVRHSRKSTAVTSLW